MSSNDNEQQTSNALVQVPAAPMALGETASSAQAAQAQAQALARYAMAERHPRNMHDVATRLTHECERPRFAEAAMYRIPFKQWNKETRQEETVHVTGPSVRFAEAAQQAMGNIDVRTPIIYDDEDKRIVLVVVTDLENNSTHSRDVTVEKTIERKKPKGRAVLAMRKNAYGDPVCVLRATEQEVTMKVEAEVSKAYRKCMLRHVPADIREDCEDTIALTMAKADKADPDAALKRIVAAFAKLGITAAQIESLLGHPLAGVIPAELDRLRGYHAALTGGMATWKELVELEATEGAPAKDDPLADTRRKVQDAIATSKAKANKRTKARTKAKASKAAKAADSAPGSDKGPAQASAPEAAASSKGGAATAETGDLIDGATGEVLLTAEEQAQGWELDGDGQKIPPVGSDG